jgi:hypothetical protein
MDGEDLHAEKQRERSQPSRGDGQRLLSGAASSQCGERGYDAKRAG